MNKLKAGFFALGEVWTPSHVDWNWWHSSDHIPENLALPGVAVGKRYVAPRSYREARFADHPAFAGSQYLMYYLFTDPVDRVIGDFGALGARVTHLGRMYEDRGIPMAGHYDILDCYVAPSTVVSPEALPYRPDRGVYIDIVEVAASGQEEAVRWYDEVHIPDMLTVRGVTGCYSFKSRGAGVASSPGLEDAANWRVFLYYLDADPLETAAEVASRLEARKAAGRLAGRDAAVKLLLSGPFASIRTPQHQDCD